MISTGRSRLACKQITRALRSGIMITILAAVIGGAGCISRYKLPLHLTSDGHRYDIKLQQTEYVKGALLADPRSEEKLTTGPGNCLVLTTGYRGTGGTADPNSPIDYDRYVRHKIFLQLPSRLEPATLPLSNNSFIQLLGEYELPVGERMFLANAGELIIDSIPDKHLFGSIDGRFENDSGKRLEIRGKFKVKVGK